MLYRRTASWMKMLEPKPKPKLLTKPLGSKSLTYVLVHETILCLNICTHTYLRLYSPSQIEKREALVSSFICFSTPFFSYCDMGISCSYWRRVLANQFLSWKKFYIPADWKPRLCLSNRYNREKLLAKAKHISLVIRTLMCNLSEQTLLLQLPQVSWTNEPILHCSFLLFVFHTIRKITLHSPFCQLRGK